MHPLLEAFFTSDLFGKIIFLTLFILSILSWSLFLQKISYCRQIRKAALSFKPSQFSGTANHPFAILLSVYRQGEHEGLNSERLLVSTRAEQRKVMEKGLFLLPTVVSLAPFLGLLGTVWGILLTFHELQHGAAVQGNATVMGGLAMALGTTVVGLLVAIPALVSYNYLRAQIRQFCVDMETFSEHLLAKSQ